MFGTRTQYYSVESIWAESAIKGFVELIMNFCMIFVFLSLFCLRYGGKELEININKVLNSQRIIQKLFGFKDLSYTLCHF